MNREAISVDSAKRDLVSNICILDMHGVFSIVKSGGFRLLRCGVERVCAAGLDLV